MSLTLNYIDTNTTPNSDGSTAYSAIGVITDETNAELARQIFTANIPTDTANAENLAVDIILIEANIWFMQYSAVNPSPAFADLLSGKQSAIRAIQTI